MAVDATSLDISNDDTPGTSMVSGSITPTADVLVLASVVYFAFGAHSGVTCAGNGLTWVQVAAEDHGSGDIGVATFRSMGSSPSAGAVTFTIPSSARAYCSITEFSDVDTGGTNGSAAVVQSKTGSSSSDDTEATVTFDAAFGDATNHATYQATAKGGTMLNTPGSGFTELADISGAEANRMQDQWRLNEDASPSITWTGNSRWSTLAIEIKSGGLTVTLYATGDGTITTLEDEGGATTDLWQSIDDDPATPTDADWINNINELSGGDASGFFDITNTPAEFGNADGASIVVRVAANDVAAAHKLYVRLFKSDETTTISDEVELLSVSTPSGQTNYQGTITGVSAAATKAEWDAARIKLRWSVT